MDAKKDNFYVPWPDDIEWNNVRNQILSSEINKKYRGYQTILMWKLKYNSLPAYIESTLSLLQVIIKKNKMMSKDKYSLSLLEEHELRLASSTALIRFVNHVSSIGPGKHESLYWSAKTQNIPDWVINMRHEAAHSQNLPTLDALNAALDISLKWLLDNYWNENNNVLKKNNSSIENVCGNSELNSEKNVKVADLFKKAFDIWDYCLNKKNLFIGEIKQEFIQHVEEFVSIQNQYFKKTKIDKILNIQNMINHSKTAEDGSDEASHCHAIRTLKVALLKMLQTILKTENYKQIFISSLLESSFLTENNVKISKWSKILEMIHKVKLLEALIISLFEMAGNGHEKASKWLLILYPSIKLLHKKWAMFKTLKKENKNLDVKKLKKKLGINTNHRKLLNFNISKPPSINLKMMNEVLLNPETHHLKEIILYLKFIKPPLPESTVKLINDLIQIQESAETDNEDKDESENNERIYTVDDLKTSIQENVSFESNVDTSDDSGWIKCEIDVHAWSKCPLGLLPFQTKVDCNLPDDLKWTVESRQMNEAILLENTFDIV